MTSTQRHRLGMSILLAGSMLFISACGSADSEPATSGKSIEAAAPAETGKESVNGQTATITLSGDTFDTTAVNAKPGVVTIRLNNPGTTAARLAIRQGDTVLAEGEPASGAQISEVTIPAEAGATYEYFLAGRKTSTATGTVNVAAS